LTTECGLPILHFIISDSSIRKIRITNLTSNTAYTIKITGINSRGLGKESEFASAQTRISS